MTIDEAKKNLASVINTLNTIDIKGKDNMNHMLGSILVIEKVIQELQETKVEPKENE